MPVVRVATSLGLRWQEQDFAKYTWPAVITFLDPIPPGLGKDEMLARLGEAIGTNTDRLIEEGSTWDVAEAVLHRAGKPSSVVKDEAAT